MYCSSNSFQFRTIVLEQLGFQPIKKANCLLYQNPEFPKSGSYRLYQREGFYDFGLLTIQYKKRLEFNLTIPIRYCVLVLYMMEQRDFSWNINLFLRYAFRIFSIRKRNKRKTNVDPGQHFQGAEITIYPNFFEEIQMRFSNFSILEYFFRKSYLLLPSIRSVSSFISNDT